MAKRNGMFHTSFFFSKLGEELFRTSPLRHYRTGKLLSESKNGEGKKGKNIL